MAETFTPPGAAEWHAPITAGKSKDVTMEEPIKNFFGSEKAGRVREIANIMIRQESKLNGGMLNEMISLALTEPELDRDGTSQKLMARFNYDETADKPVLLDHSKKAEALRTAMQYFDDLQELRNKVLEQKRVGK